MIARRRLAVRKMKGFGLLGLLVVVDVIAALTAVLFGFATEPESAFSLAQGRYAYH